MSEHEKEMMREYVIRYLEEELRLQTELFLVIEMKGWWSRLTGRQEQRRRKQLIQYLKTQLRHHKDVKAMGERVKAYSQEQLQGQ